jgi:hypothetical protein
MSETVEILGETSWTRVSEGIEKVKARLRRATALFEAAGLPHAVIAGNAVAAWVSRVDDSVVRNTRDVDLLVRRADMDAIITAMAAGGASSIAPPPFLPERVGSKCFSTVPEPKRAMESI